MSSDRVGRDTGILSMTNVCWASCSVSNLRPHYTCNLVFFSSSDTDHFPCTASSPSAQEHLTGDSFTERWIGRYDIARYGCESGRSRPVHAQPTEMHSEEHVQRLTYRTNFTIGVVLNFDPVRVTP